uniref:Uncharacterized protein n=1 Tax=Anguilla anguilla TaxID=7936 RepID=A0A0E9Q2S4_ANGAN
MRSIWSLSFLHTATMNPLSRVRR